MKTAIENYGGLPPKVHDILTEATRILRHMPDAPRFARIKNGLWSCHAVVRAVARILSLEKDGWNIVDGYFVSNFSHSWLLYEDGQYPLGRRFILDVYPVAALGSPMLVSVGITTPWQKLYIPSPQSYVDRQNEFNEETNIMCSMISIAA